MSFQIKKIILYKNGFEPRILNFKLNSLNIITGESQTGKSSIINIIDYCLARSTFNVSDGVVRKNVDWYSIIIQNKHKQLFIAKPKPKENKSEQSLVFFKYINHEEVISYNELKTNTNDTGLLMELNNFCRLKSNRIDPDKNSTQKPFEVNIRHSKFFLFQNQTLIADNNNLFYRQFEDFIPQTIKNSLPFFLGVISENYVQTANVIKNKKRKLKLIQKDYYDKKILDEKSSSLTDSLYSEAVSVGLLEMRTDLNNSIDLRALLRSTMNWKPYEISKENLDINEILTARKNTLTEINDVNEKIHYAEQHLKLSSGFSMEATEQLDRLQSIELFSVSNNQLDKCPLCNAKLNLISPSVENFEKHINKIKSNLNLVDHSSGKLIKYIDELKNNLRLKENEYQKLNVSISEFYQKKEEFKKIENTNNIISKVIGRISLFLETTTENFDFVKEQVKINKLKSEIENLELSINKESQQEKLNSKLNLINVNMTSMAKKMKLEFMNFPYRLDFNRLTVIVDGMERPIPLYLMGGGSNWVGCHIITLLSMHKLFLKIQSSVPRFIVLDQPSQVYFSNDIYLQLDGSVNSTNKSNGDLIAVKRMFKVLFDYCQNISGVQIIVLEHANLINDFFQKSLVEKKSWTQEHALIPKEWYT